MNQKTQMVLKAWLSKCPSNERSALERFLPESERKEIEELPSFDTEAVLENSSTSNLSKVHWSWFLPTLKTFALRDQNLFLSSLDSHAADQLKAALNISTPLEAVTEMGKTFLQEQLSLSLFDSDHEILPVEFLPICPLNELATLGKKDLIRLINLLALYDLCAEFRQIVETKILKKIYNFLSREHQAALKTISSQVLETHLFPRLGLDRGWDGTEESFHVLMHRRGLTRLGVALSGKDPDLIWTICHHLDIGRGGSLLKLCGKKPAPGITDIVAQQVIESLHLLNGKG